MNSSPTPSSPTRLPRSPEVWRLGGALWAVSALLLPTAALAHGEADDPLPAEPGLSWDAAAAIRSLDRRGSLPSTRLAGQLLQGDAGTDPQGTQLEHGTLGLAGRLDGMWGARLVLSKHGSEAAEVEEAWVQARHDADNGDSLWLNAGRMRPASGPVLGSAGHFDRFGLSPLAQRMAWDHDWVADGAQLSWRSDTAAGRWSADLGLWRGPSFPGSDQGPTAPSLHLGWATGPWSLDGVWAGFRPRARGTSASLTADHSHASPECNASLVEVVCFDGRSRLAGASLRWSGRDAGQGLPLTLALAGWLRSESGRLESADGLADYQGRSRGMWADAIWHLGSGTELGWRAERVVASHRLAGAGASLVARAARLDAYAPVTRHTLSLGQRLTPWAEVRLELGREGRAGAHVRFAALRLLLATGGPVGD